MPEVRVQQTLVRDMKVEAEIVSEGASRAVRRTLKGMKTGSRREIGKAGLGPRLPRLVSARWSKFEGDLFKRVGGRAGGARRRPLDYIDVFSKGAIIRPARGRFLAVPTEQAPRSRRNRAGPSARMTPDEMGAAGLKPVFIESGNGGVIVIRSAGGGTVVTHVLVRSARIQKRFDIDKVVNRWNRRYEKVFVDEMDKEALKRARAAA